MPESPALTLARRAFYLLGSGALVVLALDWGRKILIPFALAILLTLVLAPLVSWLERRGLRRVPAVLLVVFLTVLVLGATGWAVATQLSSLVSDLPRHKENVREKVAQLQGAGKSSILATVEDFLEEIERASQPPQTNKGTVVRLQPERPSLFVQLQAVVTRFLGALTAALSVLLLVVCVLCQREDLRNRVIRLAGKGRLTLTTRALDEAGQRIGRYLLGQSLVNAGLGLAVGLGLLLIGVQYPFLWGFLAGVLRFVPYVGLWLAAPFPVVLALISSPGPTRAVLVLVLFLVLEVVCLHVIEAWVCGPSIGVAPVPLLLAVTFWTGLWGIIGLVLATPLTVCLAVLGKHVPQLEFLAVLLGSRPALKPAARYYQRLLARDRDEAEAIVKDYLGNHSVERLYDNVLLPALVLVKRGRQRGELRSDDETVILQATRELVTNVAAFARTRGQSPAPELEDETPRVLANAATALACPACDQMDEVALLMLRPLLRAAGYDVKLAGATAPSSGMVALVQQERPALVFIAALAPSGLTQARYLCRRLRAGFPSLQIVVGRWGRRRDPTRARQALLAAGADRVVATLAEARRQLAPLSRSSASLQGAT
jgi:predicted PurR-regulated permease PerM